MKFWITKYALSKGIMEVQADVPEDNILRDPRQGVYLYYYGDRNEWHTAEESAVREANAMVQSRIASLERQLRKLRAMTFAVQGERA